MLTPGILSLILRAHAYRVVVVVVVRPVLFYGYNSKLVIPSRYGLLNSYICSQLLSIYPLHPPLTSVTLTSLSGWIHLSFASE